jgi:FtsH-binding integral membrane protein
MKSLDYINTIRVWEFLVVVLVILFVVAYISYVWGDKSRASGIKTLSDVISNNILGLLALLLGFSFSMAVNRYDVRRVIAVTEANAIGTAYIRSSLINFDEPEQVKTLFKKYADLRIEIYKSMKPNEVIEKLNNVQDDILGKFRKVARKERGELESAYLESLNEMFDVANSRNFALFKMLPPSFYILILIIGATAIGLINFDRGFDQDKSHWRATLFIVLFVVVFTFIFDLDHYRGGLIQLGQDAMLQVREKM